MKDRINWVDHAINVCSVIVGVSLAFWVNDSAARKKQSLELSYAIDSFIEELSSDSNTYVDYQIPSNLQQVEDINAVIDYLARNELDSLAIRFEGAVGLNNYHPSATTFNSLSSAGKLDLIGDFEVKQAINEYHTVTSKEAEWRGRFQVDYYTNEMIPWMIRNLDLVNPDFSDIDRVELRNLLIIYAGVIENKINQYQYVAREAGHLKRQLESLKDE